jgi:hypothetical protein
MVRAGEPFAAIDQTSYPPMGLQIGTVTVNYWVKGSNFEQMLFEQVPVIGSSFLTAHQSTKEKIVNAYVSTGLQQKNHICHTLEVQLS